MIAFWCWPSCESGFTGVESADDVLEQRAVSTWYFELPVRLLELAECACLSAMVSESESESAREARPLPPRRDLCPELSRDLFEGSSLPDWATLARLDLAGSDRVDPKRLLGLSGFCQQRS